MIKFFRETYEGTKLDMTKDLVITVRNKDDNGNVTEKKIKSAVANSWMSTDLRRLLNEIKPGIVDYKYCIAQNW